MKFQKRFIPCVALIILLASCDERLKDNLDPQEDPADSSSVVQDTLAAPYATPAADNRPKVIGWPEGKTPVAPAGFTVTAYAKNLDNPRWIYEAPNGDIFVSQAATFGQSANNILILRDADKDGTPELKEVFLKGLNKPFGMLILKGSFYVANTDGLYQYPYTDGMISMTAAGKKILELPAGGYNNHWTRNLITDGAGSKIYVSVGSGSNLADNGMENEVRRANILQINPDGSGEKIYASGLRNPVGMDWSPGTSQLWAAVNERDGLGDDLVPDYVTSVKEGGFYGWPYAYFGQHEDPTLKGQRPDLVAKTIVPDAGLGAHTASLGLAFYTGNSFPANYQGGAFIGQHGSWNRSTLAGFRVAFLPFKDGKPTGKIENFLTGFIKESSNKEVYGKPVCVRVLKDGSMLVADDEGNTIWKVIYGR